MARDELLAAYRRLVLHQLPERARREGWVVVAEHCSGRIVLDSALGQRWYDVQGDALLRELDGRSLAWRGKQAKG